MEFLGSIFGIGKDIWETTGNWFGYINSLDANMQNLKRKIGELSTQEDDINTQLTSAEQQPRKRRKGEVDNWLHDVQTIKADVQTLQRKQQEVVGWKCVFSRAQLGKQVAEKIQEVEKLREKGTFSNGLMIDTLPNSGGFIRTPSLGETTSARNKENVWNCLMDDEVRRIGVYGMGGVGKTTIMHHINNKLLKEKTHDGVFWVTVSKAFNVRNLQRRIAEAMDLNLPNYGDETRRASELHAMFSRKKRYVLILDDLWEAFDLKKVGIPEPDRDNGCKLVLTTRSSEVCRQMKCREIKVELLMEEEALNLFMTTVEEDQTKLDREVKEIATKVAKECARLPLAIITVAGSMRESRVNDIHKWKNALNELISPTKQIRGTISDPVFERLKFSYSRLKDEKLQHCFLYCALYPEDHNIPREELIEHWIAEELITEMNSREKMFNKGHTILNKLIDTCLLESVTVHYGKCVRMHDLVRYMALKITSTSPRFMVRAGEGLERVPYEDWSEDLERVSLMFNRINELPSRPPICPRLTTLLLREGIPSLLRIPDSFFLHMPRLKVLDLSNNNMQFLPKSIFKLKNLLALSLEGCYYIKYVPSLKKLKALRELKLNGTDLKEVPQGIEELVNLRNLDLSWNYRVHTFPGQKLFKLTQLQRLRIDGTRAAVLAGELLCLTQLEVVGAQFQNVQELSSYVTSQQCQRLKNYRFLVGNCFKILRILECEFEEEVDILENEVYVSINPAHSGSGVDLAVLPNNIKSFGIRNCHDFISFSDILSLRDAKDLRKCIIIDCNGIESIISTSSSFSEDCQIPLRTVEILRLGGLPNFRVLFDGVVPPHNISFKLKELLFYRCSRIKNIFPVNLLQNFPNLEKLEVQNCENVEDIIVDEEMNDRGGHCQDDRNTIIILRNLKYLWLEKLPRLKSICKSIMVCESIQDIDVGHCPMLRRMPLSLHKDVEKSWSAPPALQSIRGSEEWWESLIWDDPHSKTTLQPFLVRSRTSTVPDNYEDIDSNEDDNDNDSRREDEDDEGTEHSMEFFGSIFKIGKDILEGLGYINSLHANMQNLKRKIEELSSQEDDITTELTSAGQQPRKRRKKVVDDWLLAVQTIKGDVQTLQRQQQEVVGWKYVIPRAQLGKLVAEKIQEVEKLQEKVPDDYEDIDNTEDSDDDDSRREDEGDEVITKMEKSVVREVRESSNLRTKKSVCSDPPLQISKRHRVDRSSSPEEDCSRNLKDNFAEDFEMSCETGNKVRGGRIFSALDTKQLVGEELKHLASEMSSQRPQSDPEIGIFDLHGKYESTSSTAPQEERLSTEEPDKEFLTKMTEKVPQSFEKEILDEILMFSEAECKEAPLDPQEMEELDDVPEGITFLSFNRVSFLGLLDLSYTSINYLPESISILNALQKFLLRGCELLTELPPEIGELSNLEVLDLEGTEIIYLPKEIAKLINLRCLKVLFYGYADQYQESQHIVDTIIPRGALSNLSRLNELSMDVNPDAYWWDFEVKTIINDLCSLQELRTLKLYLPTVELFEDLRWDSTSMIFPALAHFRFIVGRQEEHFISRLPHEVEEEFNNLGKLEKGLKYINGEGIPNTITEALQHVDAFYLQRHWTAKNLSEFGQKNMDELKFCCLVECNEFHTIIDAEQFYQEEDCEEEIVLGSLQYLSIHYMKNMESICQGPVGKGSLFNLKSLALHTCISLTAIFTLGMLGNLVNLEELIVEDCPKINSLVSLEDSGLKSGHFLPILKKILLLELPELVNISNGLHIAPKLERMVIFYCPKLVNLSTMEVSSKDLKVIKGENEWWGALKWYESDLSSDHQDYLASVFVPLRRDGDLMAQFTED